MFLGFGLPFGVPWTQSLRTTILFHLLIHRLQNYDATCRLAQEIAENIQERNRQQRTGGNPAKVKVLQSLVIRMKNCNTFSLKLLFLFFFFFIAFNVYCLLFRLTWHSGHHCRSSNRILASLRMACYEHHQLAACILFFCKFSVQFQPWDSNYIWAWFCLQYQ